MAKENRLREERPADRPFQAIVAVSKNNVIGNGGKIPWHVPDDFRWFKKKTLGHIVLMGRVTFESLKRPLADRSHLVLTSRPGDRRQNAPEHYRQFHEWSEGSSPSSNPNNSFEHWLLSSREQLDAWLKTFLPPDRSVYLCGGKKVYEQFLPRCSDLFLSRIELEVEGDCTFPPYEDQFELKKRWRQYESFQIEHYCHRA